MSIEHDSRWSSGGTDVRIELAPDDGFGGPRILLAYANGAIVASAGPTATTGEWIVVSGFRPPVGQRSRDHQVARSETDARQMLARIAGGESR